MVGLQTTPEFRWDVLLSHNSRDKPKVRPIAEALRAAGLRVWFDEWNIGPGDDIFAAVEEGLQHTRVLVLCMTPAAFGSDWVQLERGTALFRDHRPARDAADAAAAAACCAPSIAPTRRSPRRPSSTTPLVKLRRSPSASA